MDIAGLVKGAAEGQGLGNQFLAHIRETDAILQVVRFFDDPNIPHVEEQVEPYKDIEIVNLELILADSEQVRKRRDKLVRDIHTGVKEAIIEEAILAKLEQGFAAGKLALHAGLTSEEQKRITHLNLLTMKPMLYALNKKSGGHNLDELADGRAERAYALVKKLGARYIMVDAATEQALNDVADEDRMSFREELGALDDGLAGLIREAYKTLDLISFFTTGADETRAWTIPRGSTAPAAGAAIHTDFKDKFIRAEVIPTNALLAAGSFAAAREKGLVRIEGKNYIVQDGDVIVFLHG